MTDIAKLAGVSKSTVSRALADSPLVNAETKAQIRNLAQKHNYRLNTAARNFRLKETLTIAVMLPSAEQSDWTMSDPFFLDMLGAIAEALEEKGHQLLLPGIKPCSFERISQMMHSQMVDGAILIGQGSQHRQLNELSKEYPAISIWGAVMDGPQYYPTVGTNNELGGYRVTRHLLERGREKLIFIGHRNLPEIKLRFAGFQRALHEAGLDFREEQVLGIFHPDELDKLQNAFKSLRTNNLDFDGVVCATDTQAMTAIRAISHLGMTVPDHCAVVGYDDIAASSYYNPPLTTVHQSRAEGGRKLVENVIATIDGHRPENILLDPLLVVRNSS